MLVFAFCGSFSAEFILLQVLISCVVLAVPGWPLIGNLLQLKEKKPFLTFVKWAEDYGPIYSIRLGASSVVVLNSTELAKEVLTNRPLSCFSFLLNSMISVHLIIL